MTKTLPLDIQVRIESRIDGRYTDHTWTYDQVKSRGIKPPTKGWCYTIFHANRAWVWNDELRLSAQVGHSKTDWFGPIETWDEAAEVILANS